MTQSCDAVSKNDFLYTPNSTMVLTRAPTLSYTLQGLVVPGLLINQTLHPTPFLDIKEPGDKIIYEALIVTFVVTKDAENWLEIYRWMMEIAGANKIEDRKTLVKDMMSDISIVLMDGNNKPTLTLKLINAWPSAIAALPMNFTEESDPVATDITFEYDRIEIVGVDGNVLVCLPN